ncbi:MAG TPA: fumarate hydratase [Candidatus Ornithomonoglobus intestinigallinarum]|uniref:Fumarate hydratase n=1 Tax=Candidatus Ornithomonoglobus intestinigallinarum TaxID=2840894 RepID=A0A9D1H2B8_9FIRM|nr:fumarate hydratase [Candidatus Ornithomonoglobus intestinigallinarum]
MRIIASEEITNKIAELCISANCSLNGDIRAALERGVETEKSEVSRTVLKNLIKNADIADRKTVPICQDTGMAVFFADVGNEVLVEGKTLTEAINDGVRKGYTEGYLRKSVVADPLDRKNTGDNTPAVIYYDFVKGDKIKLTFAPKGFGSENKSALKMLNPSDGLDGVIDFVTETVRKAGANPCPPMVVGVGIGGTMDKCAQLSKKALARDITSHNENAFYAELENTLLEKINKLGIGPQGMGGTTTCLGVNIETFPTHIAGLPVSVNISCHATRHASAVI